MHCVARCDVDVEHNDAGVRMPRFAAAFIVHKAVNEWNSDNQTQPIEPQAGRVGDNRAPAASGPAAVKNALGFACLRSSRASQGSED